MIQETFKIKCDWCGKQDEYKHYSDINSSGWCVLAVQAFQGPMVIDWHICGLCTTRIVPNFSDGDVMT